MTTAPILAAIAMGLLDVGRHNVIVTGSQHRLSRWLLYLLSLVAALWLVVNGAQAAGLNNDICLATGYRTVALLQASASMAALLILVMSLRRLSTLAEGSDV
jgi:hypothetical protein